MLGGMTSRPGQPSGAADEAAGGPRRAAARVVVVTALLESLLLLGYGGYLVVESVVATASDPVAAVVLAILCVALSAGLAVLARAVRDGRPWARSPLLLWQALQAAVAVPALSTAPAVGAGLLAAAIVAAAGILVLVVADPGRGRSAVPGGPSA